MPSLIAVVGATGLVGREALSILGSRGIDPNRVRALASERSAGGHIPFAGSALTIAPAQPEAFADVALAIFCATSRVARDLAPAALASGGTVIDNSSTFRLEPDVPLVVPEVNGLDLQRGPTNSVPRLIANPNCSTIILLVALEPLRRAFGIRSINVATYQAVSGAGQAGVDELLAQLQGYVHGSPTPPTCFKEPCVLNVFSHDSDVEPQTGLNGEERKIIEESRKIWRLPTLRITPTCVRVPVVRAHTQAITVELGTPASEEQVRAVIARGARIRIIDDRCANDFPTPLKASGGDDVLVGRIRPDPSEEPFEATPRSPRDASSRTHTRWCLLISGDQVRKGAAGNAIQIADMLGLLDDPRPRA